MQSARIGRARLIVKVLTLAVVIVVATGTGRAEDERRVIEGKAFIHDLQSVTLELRTQFGTEILRLVGVKPMTAKVICGADRQCLKILGLQRDFGAAFKGTPLVHDTVCATLGIRDEFGQSFAICKERLQGISGYRIGLDSAEVLVLDGIVLNDPHMLPDYSKQESTAKRRRPDFGPSGPKLRLLIGGVIRTPIIPTSWVETPAPRQRPRSCSTLGIRHNRTAGHAKPCPGLGLGL